MNEPKALEDFIPLLKGWWDVNGFEGNVTVNGQFRKFIEETAELYEALKNKDEDAIKDAHGDRQVVCIMVCFILSREISPDEIDDDSRCYAKSTLSIDDLVEDSIHSLRSLPRTSLARVRAACLKNGYNPDECLAQAWNEIKDRRGHWENGVFVKHVKPEVLHMTEAPEVGTMVYTGGKYEWEWEGIHHDFECLKEGRIFATPELRDQAFAFRKEGA